MLAKYFVIEGRVQGVFYRASTEQRARQLGLVGWVRNRDDGCVECLAQGEEKNLGEFEHWLWQGPEYARVSTVHVEDAEVDGTLKEFNVVYV